MRTTAIPALLLALLAAAACEGNERSQTPPPSPRGRAHVIRDIPVLPGATVVDTTGTSEAERATWRIGLPFSAVSDYYLRELPKRGYTILNRHADTAVYDIYARRDRRDLWMHFVKLSKFATEWTILGAPAPIPDSTRVRPVTPRP